MYMTLVPGYRELFGEPDVSYDQLVSSMPSRIIIDTVIALNNELNAPLADENNQKRLRELVSQRFSAEQNDRLNKAYWNYQNRSNGDYKGYVFGRRYLLAMALRELNNYRDWDNYQDVAQHEHDLLMAYLLLIDEVNKADQVLIDEALQHRDEYKYYRMLWTPNINQYEFNEDSNIAYEMLSLLAFTKYALFNYKPYLTEYLSQFGFKKLSEFIGSVHQLSMTTIKYDREKGFSKLNWINPAPGVSPLHLDGWSINKRIGGNTIGIDDIRRLPLFKSIDRYLIIDETLFNKKHYKGPLFELQKTTTLRKKVSFDTYCSTIATDVMEKQVFRGIINGLNPAKYDVLHFDEGGDSIPDAYYRRNKKIILFEFKAYLFPAHLSDDPKFDKIKGYIDHRFIENEKGDAKGILQLIKQLQKLKNKQYDFDPYYNTHLCQKKVEVYPVIVHSEFNLTMPGIGEYLNHEFLKKLPDELKECFDIKQVLFVSLQTLFDYMAHKGSFKDLPALIERFIKIIKNRKELFKKNPGVDTSMRSYAGFDEIYNSIFIRDLKGQGSMPKLQSLVSITQEELDLHLTKD